MDLLFYCPFDFSQFLSEDFLKSTGRFLLLFEFSSINYRKLFTKEDTFKECGWKGTGKHERLGRHSYAS